MAFYLYHPYEEAVLKDILDKAEFPYEPYPDIPYNYCSAFSGAITYKDCKIAIGFIANSNNAHLNEFRGFCAWKAGYKVVLFSLDTISNLNRECLVKIFDEALTRHIWSDTTETHLKFMEDDDIETYASYDILITKCIMPGIFKRCFRPNKQNQHITLLIVTEEETGHFCDARSRIVIESDKEMILDLHYHLNRIAIINPNEKNLEEKLVHLRNHLDEGDCVIYNNLLEGFDINPVLKRFESKGILVKNREQLIDEHELYLRKLMKSKLPEEKPKVNKLPPSHGPYNESFIYLLALTRSEYKDPFDEVTFKIGRSGLINRPHKDYGSDRKIIILRGVPTDAVNDVEREIKRRFRKEFDLVFGHEYFRGDPVKMIEIINENCKEHTGRFCKEVHEIYDLGPCGDANSTQKEIEGIFYLIQVYSESSEPTYKVGKCEDNISLINTIEESKKLIASYNIPFKSIEQIEDKLMTIFISKFKMVKHKELFQGDVAEMKRLLFQICEIYQ